MPLRSSSAPVIGTLLSPFSDSPHWEYEHVHNNKNCTTHSQFSHGVPHHHFNLTSFACNAASPKSHHSASGFTEFNQESKSLGLKAIRRALSEGSLEELALYSSCEMEELRSSVTPTKSSYQHDTSSMLETAPSFSIFSSDHGRAVYDDMIRMQGSDDQEPLERTITIGENIEFVGGGGEFSFGKRSMGLIEEKGDEEEEGLDVNIVRPASPPLYLATGFGVHAGGVGCPAWDDDLSLPNVEECGDGEEYHKKMVDEYPCHPLFLKNYAQALQSNGDFNGAEEYYFRTTLANPADGEALLQYAKLVWQLHHDQDRAMSYFERASQAAPHDSSVLAAYASFLWEIEDDRDEDGACQDRIQADEGDNMPDCSRRGENPEESYKLMIEENPNNALFLRNYAQFLCQSKGDLQGAEEYYLRAIRADPGDGEIMVQYAKLVWTLHHDSKKALSYFERAAQANPEDSYVLAAYALFLWEAEDDEDGVTQGHVQKPLVQGASMSA